MTQKYQREKVFHYVQQKVVHYVQQSSKSTEPTGYNRFKVHGLISHLK